MVRLIIIFSSLILSCGSDGELEKQCYNDSDPPRNNEKISIDQGFWGDVWFWSGNFMPVGRGEICQVRREIHIYELTTLNDVKQIGYTSFYTEIKTKHIATTTSDDSGFFEIELSPGTYSIFIKEGDNYYSNRSNSLGIFPVTIVTDEITGVRIDITYKATF